MARSRILVIEDSPDILELLEFKLAREQFEVVTATSGEKGLELAGQKQPDLIILDLVLPGVQGLEVCRQLKQSQETRNVPVIMLTAKGEESDVVVGLEMGADDYVTKPFGIKELLARIRAVLRRNETAELLNSRRRLEIGSLVVDSDRYEVTVDDTKIDLTRAEFRLLRALARNRGRVLTREQLLDHITDRQAIIIDRNVDVHIRGLRKKLGPAADYIVTVRGVGYKFSD